MALYKKIISVLCIALLMSSYLAEFTNVIYADAASEIGTVSANFALSGNDIPDEDIPGDEDQNDPDFGSVSEIDWLKYYEFGGSDFTTITKYTGPYGNIVIPAKATSIAENAFDNKKLLLESIKCEEGSRLESIGNNVFSDCKKLSSVEFPKSLTTIGNNTFRNTAIRSMNIPDSVKSIGNFCFADNKWLNSVSLGKGLIRIGEYSFYNCDKLRKVNIDCVEAAAVGDCVFKGCILREVTFEPDLKSIPINIFAYADFAKNSEIVIPATVVDIQKKAFYKANNLEVVFEGAGLKEIYSSAFEGTGISKVYLPKSLSAIHESAFKDCVNITEINLPEKLSTVDIRAFKGCNNLKKVVAYRNIIAIGDEAFNGCSPELTFYALLDSYAFNYARKKKINCVESRAITYRLGKGMNNPANPLLFVADEVQQLQDPYRAGFRFDGWYLDKAKKKRIYDTSGFNEKRSRVYAKWIPIEYGVNYVLGGDDVNNRLNEKRVYRTCEAPFELKRAKRKGYSFGGWYLNPDFTGEPVEKLSVKMDCDVILYAKWVEHTYDVVYSANGGVLTKAANEKKALDPIIDLPFSSSFSVPVAGLFDSRVEEGYVNTGWNTDPKGTINNTKGVHYNFGEYTSRLTKKRNKTVKLYAEWTPIEYTINYVLDGGANNAKNPETHNVKKSVKLKPPRKPGYTFAGWYTDPEFNNKVTKIRRAYPSTVTVYAKWE